MSFVVLLQEFRLCCNYWNDLDALNDMETFVFTILGEVVPKYPVFGPALHFPEMLRRRRIVVIDMINMINTYQTNKTAVISSCNAILQKPVYFNIQQGELGILYFVHSFRRRLGKDIARLIGKIAWRQRYSEPLVCTYKKLKQ
jgi:hypothetical protein